MFQPKRDREPLDNDPPRCSQCGREPPTHAKDCPKLDSRPTIDLMAVDAVLDIVVKGGTLVLCGPGSVIEPGSPKFGATLEDKSGEISANAYGRTLDETLTELLKDWAKQQQLEQHQAEHDGALS